jgi:hypothetical protein
VPCGRHLNNFSSVANFAIRPDLALSTFVQVEHWTMPLLASGRQSNVTASFQLTFRPHLRIAK